MNRVIHILKSRVNHEIINFKDKMTHMTPVNQQKNFELH